MVKEIPETETLQQHYNVQKTTREITPEGTYRTFHHLHDGRIIEQKNKNLWNVEYVDIETDEIIAKNKRL